MLQMVRQKTIKYKVAENFIKKGNWVIFNE